LKYEPFNQNLLLSRLLEASIDGISAFDGECRYTVWNGAMECIYGVRREGVLGKSAFDVFPFMKETGEFGYFLEALAGKSLVAENRPYTVPQTGREGFFNGYYSPLRSEDGSIIGGVAVIRDITKRKRAEELLNESEEQYRLLFESNPQPMWVYDLETLLFLAVNDAAVAHYGYSREQFLSMSIKEIRPPEDVQALCDYLSRETSPFDRAGEWRHRKKDGTIITVAITSHQLNFAGRPAELVLANDITERKRAENALLESEDRYRDLVENSHELMCTHDLNGQITSVNPWAARVLGYPQETLIGMNVRDGLPPENRDEFDEYLREIKTKGFARGVMKVITARGETRLWEYYNTLRTNGVETPIVRGMAHDVTERRQALAREKDARLEAEAANRLKDEFLSTLSHELRTPLTAIIGWSDLLIQGDVDREKQGKALETISRNARSQAQLIDDLLEVSRIITGKLRLDFIPCEPQAVIEAAVESVRPTAEAKAVRLQLLLEPRVGQIFGDPDRLRQVIWNLLSNAVKFTPRGGSVQVRFQSINSHIEIAVSDSGEGIKQDFLPRVFDRFSQADGSTTRGHGGLGLGLAIVRHLVELHGGSVRAESEGEGKGATFIVRLPLISSREHHVLPTEIVHEESIIAKVRPADPPLLEGVRILLVDDEPDARELYATILGRYGGEVKTAASAGEALKYLKHSQPDVLVADIGMQGVDGYGLIGMVRALPQEKGGNTPALALTAYARTEDRARALTAGYQAHLAKPVERSELASAVAALAGLHAQAKSAGKR
jgi:PAS domain S-box-containing protein